jgi:uncharacterized protein (DUF1684 family)
MKNILFIFLALSTLQISAQDAYTKKITSIQNKLSKDYGNKNTSPLDKKDLKNFEALPFFKIDKTYKVLATLELTPKAPLFVIETSTDRKPLYQQYAIARFALHGIDYKLSIYQSQDSKYNPQYKDYLFLPFKDATNGSESYDGGRYIDVFISDIVNNQMIIDFNKAYNPYCAYSYKYSCPVPPIENHLTLAIKAGVKKGIIENK